MAAGEPPPLDRYLPGKSLINLGLSADTRWLVSFRLQHFGVHLPWSQRWDDLAHQGLSYVNPHLRSQPDRNTH